MNNENIGKKIDLLEAYQNFCTEEKCRVNSAIVRLIETHGRYEPLETLDLKNNYLGSNGLKPVLRLVQLCQTLRSLNLDGNGINNEAVKSMCEVLRDHLSISSISLRDNPISAAGGKYLLDLLTDNSSIVDIYLDGTDLLGAVQERIQSAAKYHQTRLGLPQPQLVRGSPNHTRRTSDQSAHNGATFPPIGKPSSTKAVTITPIAPSHKKQSSLSDVAPTITAPQPRPPPPAIASKTSSRLPPAKLNALREKFANRLHLAEEVKASEASKKAYEARRELQALETHATPVTKKEVEEVIVVEEKESPPPVEEEKEDQPPPATSFPKEAMGSDGGDDSWGDDEDNSVSIEGFATTASGHNNAELEEAINFNAAGPLASDTGLDQSHSTRLTLDYITKDTRSGSDEFRTSDETFTNLFEQGCKEYYDKNLDGAYLLWNDALAIAVEKKNREYIAIITHNLQRISYELLVKEGNALLEKGQLEEAGQAFELALDVGRKAHNAAWVTEMQNSRKEVQTAVFHRSHAAALAIFEKAKHMTNQTVNEDDYFIIPGTDTMVSHTEAFVNQWSRILLIQEAIYMWNDSATMAEHIGGAAGLSLRNDLINESLNAVSLYLVRLFFETENPNHLSMQRSSLYHYHEAVMLSELWTDMLQCMHGQLQHQLFCAVAAAQLGNLYLVTNQLQLAEQQFDQLVRYGRDNKDTLMEATGLTFSAVLNWQRANYAVAERQLETTLGKWELVRKEVDALRGVAREEGEEATNARKETIKERLRRAIPQDYVRVMANLCNSYKVSLYVNTYRYREGLEALEEGLIYQYSDLLLEKMMMNYTAHPSVDQIVAVSKDVGTPLIYYFLAYRYDWSNEENVFVRSESVLIWFVPLSSEIRFVEMNVSKEFNTTVTDLILKFRNGLCIDPLGTSEVSPSTDIITSLHRNAWMDPLQLLYLIFIDPIFDNLKSLFYNAPEKLVDSVVTIIPTVQLWTLPFNAFLNPRKEHCYLIEEVAVQLAFSATQCAFNSILARRCRDYGLRKDLVVVQPEVNAPVTHVRLRFPMDSHRSVEEGEAIEQVFNTSKELLLATANTNSSVLTNSCVVVKDVDSLRTALPQSHYVHIATDTTSHADRKSSNDECRGAVCVFSSFGEGLLWSSEVQHMELTAELVTLSNTNIVLDNLNCVHDDVLGLMRSFFSGGVPCVIAGQWCTPDVVPAHLFVKLYSLLERPLETIQNSTKMTTSSVKMSSARPSTDGSVGGFGATHKALVLAKAIRELMNEEDTMRFSPRGWAAYYCVGCGST